LVVDDVMTGTLSTGDWYEKAGFLFSARTKSENLFCKTIQTNMTTIVLVKEAIVALKDRTGSSQIAINKWIESEKK